jgi:transposase
LKRLHRFHLKKHPIVYLDESGFKKNDCRLYGYAQRGSRCYSSYDWQGRNQTNAIGALQDNRLFAVGLFDFSINRSIFDSWVKQMLLPQLPAQSIVVMDNATFHKGEAAALLEEAGHQVLWLPPYSPDLNPIEHCWAWVKDFRRRHRIQCIDELFA